MRMVTGDRNGCGEGSGPSWTSGIFGISRPFPASPDFLRRVCLNSTGQNPEKEAGR